MLADIRSRRLHASHDRIVRLSTFDRTSQGMMNLLGFIMSLVYMQALHGWLSAYERLVNPQNFFSPYLTQEDRSCLGRTNFLSNAVIVCRIDDLGRFVTRGQCAHSHPRGGNRPHYFESCSHLALSCLLWSEAAVLETAKTLVLQRISDAPTGIDQLHIRKNQSSN